MPSAIYKHEHDENRNLKEKHGLKSVIVLF